MLTNPVVTNLAHVFIGLSLHRRGVIRINVNKLVAAQDVSRCIYKGRGRLPCPSKIICRKLQMALSGTGQSAPSLVDKW